MHEKREVRVRRKFVIEREGVSDVSTRSTKIYHKRRNRKKNNGENIHEDRKMKDDECMNKKMEENR